MSLLDGDFEQLINDFESQQSALIQQTQWTGLLVVKMGAEVDGVQRVIVPEADRIYPNQVYYTALDGTQIGKAINVVAPHRYGRPIWIGYPPNDSRLHVFSVATSYEADPAADEAGVPIHAAQHTLRNLGWGGSYSGKVGEDVVLLEPRQIWPTTIQPWAGTQLYLPPGWVMFGSSTQFWTGSTLTDFADYVPVQPEQARWVLVELDRDLALHYTYGDLFDAAFPPDPIYEYIPARDGNRYPCGAALLKQGVSTITWAYIMAGYNLQNVLDAGRICGRMDLHYDQLRSLIDEVSQSGGGSGDITGPVSSTDNAIARWDGTGGDTLQDSGITIDDSDNVEGVESILFNAISAPAHQEGLLFYDAARDTLSVYNAEADVTMNIGEEIYFPVYNDSGSTITNGSVVYPTGFDAGTGLPTIGLADASDKDKCQRVGMVTHDIEDGTKGYVTRLGSVGDLDTAGLTGYIYLSATTPGAYVQDPPDDGSFRVCIGAVGNADASTGTIIVDPNVEQLAVEVTETNGFPPDQRTGTTFTFTDGTRTFAIDPTGTEFHFYQTGDIYTSTGDTVVIDNTEGLHAIYYDAGVLTSITGYDDDDERDLILNKCIVSELYWDATNASAIWIGDERHGISMSPYTHYYLHSTRGTQYRSGLAISDLLPDEDGSSDTHAQFGVSSGAIADEDLFSDIATVASTTGLKIFYLDGAAGNLREASEPGFSVLTDTTAGVGVTGRLVWNQYTGGAWQLTTVADNSYVLCHVFAATGVAEEDKLFAVIGQSTYGNIAAARAATTTEISNILVELPQEEFLPVATILFQTRSAYSNSVLARVVSASVTEEYVNWLTTELAQGATPSSHANLTNLEWTDSGHTGTADTFAGFDSVGAATEYDVSDYEDIRRLVWMGW